MEAEDVILGNEALMECQIPSFMSDILSVIDWVDSTGIVFDRLSYGNLQTPLYI